MYEVMTRCVTRVLINKVTFSICKWILSLRTLVFIYLLVFLKLNGKTQASLELMVTLLRFLGADMADVKHYI